MTPPRLECQILLAKKACPAKTRGCSALHWCESAPLLFMRVNTTEPHERGEDFNIGYSRINRMETPPRTWGRLRAEAAVLHRAGNIPTGVGKTRPFYFGGRTQWKHPHGRGEDVLRTKDVLPEEETPPRAWGRHIAAAINRGRRGNTPTGVGKTLCRLTAAEAKEKHPHGRGEDRLEARLDTWLTETPPRAWGRPYVDIERSQDL